MSAEVFVHIHHGAEGRKVAVALTRKQLDLLVGGGEVEAVAWPPGPELEVLESGVDGSGPTDVVSVKVTLMPSPDEEVIP